MAKLLKRFASIAITTAVATTAFTGSAAADIGAGRVQVCAQGNYAVKPSFNSSDQSQMPSGPDTWVAKGTCQTFPVPNYGYPARLTGISVIGKFNSSNGTFYVDGINVNPTAGGWKLLARGTTADGGAAAYLVVMASGRT
ncbi:hypothetical protein ACIOWI_36205 [Streptomyces sp. NPDC087659]|uniref:hypothetical protein n=1 Tax=Streptomyces sp. NPDC087659 TaxID=3365801 RepID=UPI0038056C8E